MTDTQTDDTVDWRLADGPAPVGDLMRLGRSLPEEVCTTVTIDGAIRRIRIGHESGEVFREGEDFDGLTLTVEAPGTLSALGWVQRLAGAAGGTPLERALARMAPRDQDRVHRALRMAATELRMTASRSTPKTVCDHEAEEVARLLEQLSRDADREMRKPEGGA